MKNSKYGIKIKNYQAGSLYQCSLGVRKNYDYNKAMFANNLLMYHLLEKRNEEDECLIIDKGWTRDIICINFDYGSRSYEEEINHLNNMIANKDNKYSNEVVQFFITQKEQAELNKDLFDKKSADEIREIFYQNGVSIKHEVRNKKEKIIREEIIHYKMLYRSTGKAKDGSCMFICDRLYDKAINFIRMGLQIPLDDAPIVEMSAYSSLIASSIVDTIRINPKNILVLKDIDSFFETNIISVETNDKKQCVAIPKNNYKLKNTMFDGQGLIDESIFPSWGEGYVLLRHHMCKMACFKSKIQKFFKDYYKDNYNTAIIKDMWGNDHYVKDIEIITTNNAMKWLKFSKMGVNYHYWCDKVFENGCKFGIVKTAHRSKLGEVQKMSYQMINSLDMDIMENVVKTSKQYIEQLKSDNETFLQYLKDNENFSNDYKVLVDICEYNKDFVRSEYFRNRKKFIIDSYISNFKFGKVIQNGDNLVFVGSPYAMLLHSVGEDVEKDKTFVQEADAIQCFTTRFEDNEYLACFRSPHNSKNNIAHLHNVYSEEYFKYFDFGNQIIALNVNHTDIQDRLNGCDFDSDSGYITNQTDIVSCAKKCYQQYPTIVNNIAMDKNMYSNSLLQFARVDNKLSHAQASIGTSSNIAQIAQTYMYNFNDQKYKDYVCILSVLAQISIDSAKRNFDVDVISELERIKNDMNIKDNNYPLFWKHIKDKKAKIGDKKFNSEKINENLICPMNYLIELKFKNNRSGDSTLPMNYFYQKFELENDRRKCKRVEELIENYSLDVYNYVKNDGDNNDYILLRSDFDDLIKDIQEIYISKTYIGLMSWLIDRAFLITCGVKRNKTTIDRKTNENKSLLLKILYDVNPQNVLKIFSKNLY